ncbi:unnamed protein product [Didymodactylos carnosus]|uniref:Uncharacterized protein n=1 Tax=Didymodactylos carnosus TaxID=1234261 RepID=A0A814S581_9BILA|nr:unnamed protein product [Didymodactylos carnosus]CAF1190171.1 unnamed protein product [Didymodactylos carnosus]CAF3907031.1 unnamed protein product [Didymodactylos carnosus]CAF4001180.1 unnamed protein product [Didymodactylos carnosus]
MSNSPVMNQIVVSRVYSNGLLEFVKQVNTNGRGTNVTTPDSLQSQGSIRVFGRHLFVVNPGSGTLSLFSIEESDGTEIQLVSVESTNGDFPMSVIVNDMYACVLNGGVINGFRCFSYKSNKLIAILSFDRSLTSFVTQTDPPIIFNSLSQIGFSADNLAILILAKGDIAGNIGFLLTYPIDRHGALALNPLETTTQDTLFPFAMLLVGHNSLFIVGVILLRLVS